MPMPGLISAAILCGGRGHRMGGLDKSTLMIDGQSILTRQLSALRPLTPHLMLIDRTSDRPAPPGVTVYADRIPDAGPLGGIMTALDGAPTDRVLVLACDLPFVTTEFLSALAECHDDADVIAPRDPAGRYALCAVFHRRAADTLRALVSRGHLSVHAALEQLSVAEVPPAVRAACDTDGRLLMNVNTPQDYTRAAHAATGVGA